MRFFTFLFVIAAALVGLTVASATSREKKHPLYHYGRVMGKAAREELEERAMSKIPSKVAPKGGVQPSQQGKGRK